MVSLLGHRLLPAAHPLVVTWLDKARKWSWHVHFSRRKETLEADGRCIPREWEDGSAEVRCWAQCSRPSCGKAWTETSTPYTEHTAVAASQWDKSGEGNADTNPKRVASFLRSIIKNTPASASGVANKLLSRQLPLRHGSARQQLMMIQLGASLLARAPLSPLTVTSDENWKQSNLSGWEAGLGREMNWFIRHWPGYDGGSWPILDKCLQNYLIRWQ